MRKTNLVYHIIHLSRVQCVRNFIIRDSLKKTKKEIFLIFFLWCFVDRLLEVAEAEFAEKINKSNTSFYVCVSFFFIPIHYVHCLW